MGKKRGLANSTKVQKDWGVSFLHFGCSLLCFFSLFFLNACGSKKTVLGKSYSKTCNLPSNQANSLQGKWAATPLKLSFHTGDFSGGEISMMEAAAKSWNDFFSFSKGLSIFDFGGYTTSLTQTTPTCAGGTLSDGTVVYKRQSGWTRSASAVAVTTFCTSGTTASQVGALPTIFNAIIEINYQNFFGGTTGKVPDMESILLHELGHLVGLDHSCGALRSGQSNLACPDPSSGDAMVDTVMYPSVFFDASGYGEEKRELQSNDQERANCLY